MNNEEKITEVKEILKNTNVNTLVIDAKTDNGHIMFKSNVPEVAVLNNERIKYDCYIIKWSKRNKRNIFNS